MALIKELEGIEKARKEGRYEDTRHLTPQEEKLIAVWNETQAYRD